MLYYFILYYIILQSYGTTVVYAIRRWPKRRYAAHHCIGFLRQDLRTSRDILITLVPGTVANTVRMVCSVKSHNGAGGAELCAGGVKERAKWRIGSCRVLGKPGKRSTWPGSCTVWSWEVELSWAEEMALPDETHGVTSCVCLSVCLSLLNWILVSSITFNMDLPSAHTFAPLLKGPHTP